MIVTEQPSRFGSLDTMSTRELLEGINREDRGVADAVGAAIPRIEALVEAMLVRMRKGGRVFYIGAGTSGRLGILDASEIPPTYGASHDLFIGRAVEGAEDEQDGAWRDLQPFSPNPEDTLIGIAASGSTPYVVGGLRAARSAGLLTACITCNPDSPVTAEAEIPIVAVVGPEFVTGSTRMKAGTAQKMILNMISTTVMIRLGHVRGSRMVDMQLTNAKLVDRGTRMIMEGSGIDDYGKARDLLLKYGSVRAALDSFE